MKKEKQKCSKCKGKGYYIYTTIGTPHGKLCEVCCKHKEGFWELKEHYGEDNGKLCCITGCGFTKQKPPTNELTTTPPSEDIDSLVRDLTKVGSISKSETRERIVNLLLSQKQKMRELACEECKKKL